MPAVDKVLPGQLWELNGLDMPAWLYLVVDVVDGYEEEEAVIVRLDSTEDPASEPTSGMLQQNDQNHRRARDSLRQASTTIWTLL
jgi:hypothetical protein